MTQPQSRSEILNSPAFVAKVTARAHEVIAAERDAEIAHLVDEIRQLGDEAEEIENKVRAAKAQLRAKLEARGSNWEDENGYARLIPASTSARYDRDALDRLMLKSEWWATRLRKFRRESTISSYVSVK